MKGLGMYKEQELYYCADCRQSSIGKSECSHKSIKIGSIWSLISHTKE